MVLHALFVADHVLTPGGKVARLGKWFYLTQEQWADVLGIARGTIAAYKGSANKNPSRERLKEIANRFGVPLEWFYSTEDSDPPVVRDCEKAEDDAKAKEADLDGSIVELNPDEMTREEANMMDMAEVWLPTWDGVAGNDRDDEEWHFSEDAPAGRMRVPRFFFFGKDPKEFIVCNPKGFSMAPRIIQGDHVIVHLESNPPPNSIIVARRPDGINFLKVFRVRNGLPELHSVNDNYPVIAPLDGWVCRGVAIAIWKPYTSNGTNVEINMGMPLRA